MQIKRVIIYVRRRHGTTINKAVMSEGREFGRKRAQSPKSTAPPPLWQLIKLPHSCFINERLVETHLCALAITFIQKDNFKAKKLCILIFFIMVAFRQLYRKFAEKRQSYNRSVSRSNIRKLQRALPAGCQFPF